MNPEGPTTRSSSLSWMAVAAVGLAIGAVPALADLPTEHQARKDAAPMALVPEGSFTFGMNQADMRKLVTQRLKEKVVSFYLREIPRQKKTLPAFYIDRFEVTNRQYQRFVRETGNRPSRYVRYPQFNGERQPVVGIGWADAERYCRWANKRLPTEEEWEKAARGTDGRIWPWGNEPDNGRYNGRQRGLYAPINVGSLPAGNSPYGVSDLAGNVWEMTSSRWDDSSHVMKGGSFLNTNADVRAVVRWAAADEQGGANWYGFRCVMDVAQVRQESALR
jgi:iron(II)-dependent oxidoreductase